MHAPARRFWAALWTVLVAAVIAPGALFAQEPPPVVTPPSDVRTQAQAAAAGAGYDVSNAQIADAIRQSGMSNEQLREQLQLGGYDPGLIDAFMAARSGGEQDAPAGEDFVGALQALGVLGTGVDEVVAPEGVEAPARIGGVEAGVFGKDIFRRASTAFDPVTSGPVDPGYRLGVGDQLQLILTGDVELAYSLVVNREGTVVIPQVGQVSLAGLTLAGARTLVTQRAGASYSGLTTGGTVLDLTIAGIRTNAVFVIGEVEDPGAYQVNALGTVFHALARAGGPTLRGSFRAVEIRRDGAVINTMDLYDYLLDGDASDDIRLEQGDVIFVRLNYRAVAVRGAVRRPGIFELAPGEGFADLIGFAGGLAAEASQDRIQVDRILPPEEREPGVERVKVDMVLGGDVERGDGFPLLEGDILTVFEVAADRRNTVTISGAVWVPGEYEFSAGMTIDSLIARAQGYQPYALRDRVLLRRLLPETGRRESMSLNLEVPPTGDLGLDEFDQVVVLDGRRDYPLREITVTGSVNEPGSPGFLESETLRDAVDRAGGFAEEAQFVELARRRVGDEYSDTTSILFHFTVAEDFAEGGSADQVIMEPFDHLDVRAFPGHRTQRFVQVSGEFESPGSYAITEGVDRISDLVQRAGGTLPHSFPGSFQLVRNGLPVAVEYDGSLRASRESDLLLQGGDVLSIGVDLQTVSVTGAVSRPSIISYIPGRSLEEYVELAGGPTDRGQTHRAVVSYANGLSKRVERHLWLFKSTPEVTSGSVIDVPAKAEGGASTGEVLTRVFQVSSTITSLVLAWAAITR